MIKSVTLASLLVFTAATGCYAQAGGSDREGGGADKGAAAQAPQPETPSRSNGSMNSDRSGGKEKTSNDSNGNAANAPVNSGNK